MKKNIFTTLLIISFVVLSGTFHICLCSTADTSFKDSQSCCHAAEDNSASIQADCCCTDSFNVSKVQRKENSTVIIVKQQQLSDDNVTLSCNIYLQNEPDAPVSYQLNMSPDNAMIFSRSLRIKIDSLLF